MATIDVGSRRSGLVEEREGSNLSSLDVRFVAALEEYGHLLGTGPRPDRAEFLARHPEIAAALSDCLDALELVQSAAGDLDVSGQGAETTAAALPPARLGEFRIVGEVGRGGMGVVYEAEQLPLGRRVALKVLPSTASLDPRRCQRFQVEAQAAALLHHEHIVPIFAIGFDQGAHFYAMQFIEGRSLADVIRELRAAPAPPSRSGGSSECDWRNCRAVARLALQAADALEHAHAVGVIHRDIKPSNLLIDARGHLWVADFGLARLPEEDHDLTRTGDLVGTLRYMSPEQARGERGGIDPRTDIYALGATLYELLTLEPAFDAKERHELLRRILQDEPVAPRRLNPSIPRDLETIVLKALSKEPSARCATARALGDDLRRFLDDQSILARRPGVLDRAVKWSRRHRAAVVAATVGLFVTLVASTAILWESKRRTDMTLAAYRQARIEERIALENSLGALDRITRLVGPDASAAAGAPARAEAQQILPIAIAYYDLIPKMSAQDDLMREAIAKALRQGGRSRLVLGQARGRENYRRAIRVYEAMAAQSPDHIWYRTGLIETLREYAGLLHSPDDAAESTAVTARALEVATGLIGNEQANIPCYSKALAAAFNDLAWHLVARPSVSREDATAAVRLARQSVTWEPALATFWNTLGVAHYRLADFTSATAALDRSMALNHGGDPSDWFILAAIHHRRGEGKQAREWYDRALGWVHQHPNEGAAFRALRDEVAKLLDSRSAQAG